ncbi:MAG: TetR/AcrR family transcriptional regulator [Deltaproteobacteria bacterium]|nr:TetR/AcrR family transcriptional regulator [Deltaproteobacteria bacterium]
MSKGEETRQVILGSGLDLVSEVGLEGLTIGSLASRVGMSKSGLFAHFGSKEELQCAVLDAAAESFVEVVLRPAFRAPRGVPRIEALFERWLRWPEQAFSGGCPIIAAATELDDRPGPVRDRLLVHLGDLYGSLARAARLAVEQGDFRADLEPKQFAYELWANMVAYHHHHRLFDPAEARQRARRMFEEQLGRARPA